MGGVEMWEAERGVNGMVSERLEQLIAGLVSLGGCMLGSKEYRVEREVYRTRN